MWNLIVELWNLVLLEPVFNLISLLIAVIPGHNFGLALILFTLLLRFILHPIIKKQMLNIKKQRELQPEVLKIKKANKGNRQREAMETMALYKERNFNPFAILGYILIQLPIAIALYQVIRRIIDNSQSLAEDSYGFIQNLGWIKDLSVNPEVFDPTIFGLVDLTRSAWSEQSLYFGAFAIVLLATAIQYLMIKQMSAHSNKGKKPKKLRELFKEQEAGKEIDKSEVRAAASGATAYILPGFFFFISLNLFVALPFYWFINGVIQYFQQKHINQNDSDAVKAVIDGQDTLATFERPLNAKQKKAQAYRNSHKRTGNKRVSATARTINKSNKQSR